ncbi:hypothetical protein NDU88_003070 [Pleurodeles waltl]|uniref:Uncharacterized protein n=1 Tax=Pleurodeles waltl TaxID=8319 RepID=A0AAV7MZ49_PLEWA|nr:hypothetical protein NDU88_003070 [Pleurodeles waltl]
MSGGGDRAAGACRDPAGQNPTWRPGLRHPDEARAETLALDAAAPEKRCCEQLGGAGAAAWSGAPIG